MAMDLAKAQEFCRWFDEAISKSAMSFKPGQPVFAAGIRRMPNENPVKFDVYQNQCKNGYGQGVYIANPYHNIPTNINGLGKPGYNGPQNTDGVVTQFIQRPEFNAAVVASMPQELKGNPQDLQAGVKKWINSFFAAGQLNDQDKYLLNLPQLASPQVFDLSYITYGLQKMSRKGLGAVKFGQANENVADFYGVCDNFTCCCVAISGNTTTFYNTAEGLKKSNPLPAGISVEIVSCRLEGAVAHVFSVVNRRAGSDINDPTNWGENCVVMDVWYGLQRFTSAMKNSNPPALPKCTYHIYNLRQGVQAEVDYFTGLMRSNPEGVEPPKRYDLRSQKVWNTALVLYDDLNRTVKGEGWNTGAQ